MKTKHAQNTPHHGVRVGATRKDNKVSWPVDYQETITVGEGEEAVATQVTKTRTESKVFKTTSAAKHWMRTGM